MNAYITADEAAQILAKAFAPFRCVAEPWDYGERIRFRVFDVDDEPLLTVEELKKKQFSKQEELQAVIATSRARLTQRGKVFDEMSP
ncbi:hypothetical protein D3C81_827200 [compost metagenome]